MKPLTNSTWIGTFWQCTRKRKIPTNPRTDLVLTVENLSCNKGILQDTRRYTEKETRTTLLSPQVFCFVWSFPLFSFSPTVVNCPTRQSTCYCSLGLSIHCLVGSGDLLFGGVDCIGNHAGKKWPIWVVNYFANFKNYMSQDVEFRCYHLVFGVFCHQIHVKKSWISEIDGHLWCVAIFFGNSWTWWEHCVLREQDGSLRISENDGYIVAIIFGNSRLYVAIIFRNSWKPRKMDLFCGLKSVFALYFFVIQPIIYIGIPN